VSDDAVPDLYRLAYMPGCFRCPQCDFHYSVQTINVARGEIGTTEENRQSEPCPNDGTMMVHVTYKEQVEACHARLKEEFDKWDTHLASVGQFLNDMYATMIDPVEQPIMKVDEMCALLLKTATAHREKFERYSTLMTSAQRAARMLRDQHKLSANDYEQKYYPEAGPMSPVFILEKAIMDVKETS